MRDLFLEYLNVPATAYLAVTTGFLLAGLIGSLQLYLRGDINLKFDRPSPTSEVAMLRREIPRLRDAIHHAEARLDDRVEALSVPDREELLESLRASISDELDARLLSELEERFSSSVREGLLLDRVRELLASAASRLEVELERLSRRGNLNLAIGVATTAAAVALLVYMITGAETEVSSVYGLLSYYIPRITVVVFIEVFSFFFLRLYRSTLTEVKYYQNELTSLSLLAVALETSMLADDAKVLAEVSKTLSRADRNRPGAFQDLLPAATAPVGVADVAKLIEQVGKIVAKSTPGLGPGSS